MAVIQGAGDSFSKIISPRAGFILTIQILSGDISTGWRLYYSDDKGETWKPAQNRDFSADYTDETYNEIPSGCLFRVQGGTGDNLRIHANYIAYAEPMGISIERDIK